MSAHLRESIRLLMAQPLRHLVSVGALFTALLLLALSLWGAGLSDNLNQQAGEQLSLHLRLDPALNEAETEDLLRQLSAHREFKDLTWVGPEAQRADFEALLGPELLEGLDTEVFPQGALVKATLEVNGIKGRPDLDRLLTEVASLQDIDGIDTVPLNVDHLHFLLSFSSTARILGFTLSVIALISAFLSIFDRIHSALLARQDEVRLLWDFGAESRWMFARYYLLSLTLGLFAWILVNAVTWLIDPSLRALSALLPGQISTEIFGFGFTLISFAVALGLSALAAYRATKPYLKGER